MAIGIIGIKKGMTRVFDADGTSIPVTVIHAEPNRVAQVKSAESDHYDAVQVVHGSKRENRIPRPMQGHFEKSSVSAGDCVREFRVTGSISEEETEGVEPGDELSVNQFFEGQVVDVVGTSKGKGYAGVIKRWNFQRQDMSHGNSLSHRSAGSIGQCQTPGKVFKGKKMAGHMGDTRVTVQNLKIVRLMEDRDLILVKGAVPGPTGGRVVVKPATKKGDQVAPVVEAQESN